MIVLFTNLLKTKIVPLLIVLFVFTSHTIAQERIGSSTIFGIAAAYSNTPEDADYNDSGGNGEIDKFDLFLDFGTIRLGVNAMHGLHKSKDPETRLRSNSLYIAYRARAYEDRSKIDAYLMGGIAMVSSAIHVGDTVESTSDEYGYLLGAGVSYFFIEPLALGIQLVKISATGDFEGDSIQSGSNQIQMVFLYPF